MSAPISTIRLLGSLTIAAIIALACGGAPGVRVALSPICSLDGYHSLLCRQDDGRDSDGDGLPDALENLFGTDASSFDSDGDGIGDAVDPCPLLSGRGSRGGDRAVRQAAVDYLVRDIERLHVAIPIRERQICYDGIPGLQLHGRELPWEYAVLRFSFVRVMNERATVEVFLGGGMSGCVLVLTLELSHGSWEVVSQRRTLCA